MEPLATIGAVVIGGAITGGVTWVIGRIDTRRRHRLAYLIETYEALHSAANRALSRGHADALEAALDRVFLYGNAEQLRLSKAFVAEFSAKGSGSLDALLLSLRQSVRRELGLTRSPEQSVPTLRVMTPKDVRRSQGL